MIITEQNQAQTNLQHLAALYQAMVENDDLKHANKILDVYEKLNRQELMISFAGHFSAGKSSMINSLLGKSILPKSPIPTSANVVKIKSGKGIARVYFHDTLPVEYEEPYDIEMIKEYAKDKASIKEIEISTKENILPDECVIIDTPGIDAADDADRIMTESSLHLVDALFYVMDYNHVQSEVNLQFLKKVQDNNIPFYIIINQIDKHDESELTFETFKQKIKQTFDQWNIFPEVTYYTSLIDSNAAYNEFPVIKDKLNTLMTSDKEFTLNTERSVIQVIDEHKRYLDSIYEESLAEVSPSESDKFETLSIQLENINSIVSNLKSKPKEMERDFLANLNATLKNAYLLPSDLRDKAELFLESQIKDFKVGFFASKKKTEEERETRLNKFYNHLLERIDAAIQWKLRDKFLNLLKQYNIHDQNLVQQIQQFSIDYDKEALLSLQNPGATVNGDYILNYTNDVSADIKKRFKMEALKLWDLIYNSFIDEINDEIVKNEKEQEQLYHLYEQQERQEELKTDLREKYQLVDTALDNPNPSDQIWHQINDAIKLRYKAIKQTTEDFNSKAIPQTEVVNETQEQTQNKTVSIDNVLTNIENTIATIDELPGFQSIIDDLTRKQVRLNNRTYTIALFGAFSAGKSSFANALIGENILPVSPNPTTAVINRINPVNEAYGHGTVVVKFKDEQTLVDDIRSLTRHFSPEAVKVEDLVDWIMKNNIHQSEQLHQTHQTYLNAIINGFSYNMDAIAQEVIIDIGEFSSYVTDETKACYIESVDLYYDCSLTRDGITLVDTPGADSVNARHTNVSFDYIKHADAILYVTYYNHALARADKDFLMQLGRVKDVFQLDKMFFIMNAADLAEDNSELKMVMNYIEEQLTQLGIRFPRLYPISSKQSLREKLNNEVPNKQMRNFEETFNNFIHYELAALTIQSVGRDIYRASQSIKNYIDSLQLNATEKENYREDLYSKRASLEQLVDKIDNNIYVQKINQKIEKQLFYVLERESIRFHDMFKETFNPTTITESGRKAQVQLEQSLSNLLDYAGYELMQELRAVSLRVESFITEMKKDIQLDYSTKSNLIDNNFLLPDFDDTELETPAYNQAFTELDVQTFHKELKRFNGTKAFFVKNEKEQMKEDIFNRLSPFVKRYIEESHQKMSDVYTEQWNVILDYMKEEIKRIVRTHIDNYLSMVTDQPVDIDTLQDKNRIVNSIVAVQEKMEA
ncbi:small GTP-binding protein domain-containing protein [Virgibacillus subterraneus]|uniref:Small GTP-binding protein domain-containing protein n=1 Tax=Virgibacillus subterraneus TaxID=621109 RepID=A0A1H9GWS6_9BACI|nr:dynamin family protein [Virgibacillus subterraneus]SEQ54478.1 small GTP-binding protein domain-containing protein [Virgibacillus subterraneus]